MSITDLLRIFSLSCLQQKIAGIRVEEGMLSLSATCDLVLARDEKQGCVTDLVCFLVASPGDVV
jgi:hypothetical protein